MQPQLSYLSVPDKEHPYEKISNTFPPNFRVATEKGVMAAGSLLLIGQQGYITVQEKLRQNNANSTLQYDELPGGWWRAQICQPCGISNILK